MFDLSWPRCEHNQQARRNVDSAQQTDIDIIVPAANPQREASDDDQHQARQTNHGATACAVLFNVNDGKNGPMGVVV